MIALESLTPVSFAPFGDVVDTGATAPREVNQGFARRFDGVANVDVLTQGGFVNVGLFTANPRPNPIAIKLMERHPLGSQMFYPLQDQQWIVVVCADPRDTGSYRGFKATGRQGVNYARNVWHHPLLVLKNDSRFIVVDREGPGQNLEEVSLEKPLTLGAL